MPNILETKDCTGRLIRLTKEQWVHINSEHPEVAPFVHLFEQALKTPTKTTASGFDNDVRYYYLHIKEENAYLLLIVKYLNGDGFIITVYMTRTIK